MWRRSDLKSKAKDALRKAYWKAFLVGLLIALSGGSNSGRINITWLSNATSQDYDKALNAIAPYYHLIIFIIFVITTFYILFRFFVGFALEIGCRRYFIKAAQNNIDLDHLGYAFKNIRYYFTIKTMFWRALQNTLWYLLFIIPGIIKTYSYRMVPYILADNPEIGHKRAIEISNKMTKGHKFNIFILDLSFIGWYIVGTCALIVGRIFVRPYVEATNAELYLILRQDALDKGICSYDELLIDEYRPIYF